MFIKTKVRDLLELLGRNTVAEVQALFLKSGRSWDQSGTTTGSMNCLNSAATTILLSLSDSIL